MNESYRIAIRIGDPRSAQLAVKKVMCRRKQRSALDDQCAHGGISVVGPKNYFDPAPLPFWTKAVVLSGRRQRRNSQSEPIQSELDVDGFAEDGLEMSQQNTVRNRRRLREEDPASRDLSWGRGKQASLTRIRSMRRALQEFHLCPRVHRQASAATLLHCAKNSGLDLQSRSSERASPRIRARAAAFSGALPNRERKFIGVDICR